MGLKTTAVAKCLENKLMIFGFEVLDVLGVFFVLSILNFIFGQTQMKLLLVWAPTLALAIFLSWGKRGKPPNYWVHWIRYQIKPGTYSAFNEATQWAQPPTRRKRGDL